MLRAAERFLVLATGLLLAAGAHAQPSVEVTPAQERYARERMDDLAVFEASLNVCGDRTDVVSRVTVLVEACVDPDVIARLAEYWTEKLTELGDLALVDENRDDFCRDPELKQSLAGYITYIDDLVVQAEELCR